MKIKNLIFTGLLLVILASVIYYFSVVRNHETETQNSNIPGQEDFTDSIMNQPANISPDTSVTTASNTRDTTSKHIDRKVIVYYFHATTRCLACINIENYTQEVVETKFRKELKDKKIYFKSINFETSSNEHIIEDYKLTSSSVIVALYEGKKRKSWKNLEEVWDLEKDKEKFSSYTINEIKQFLKKL
jgi:hypothetical protein